MIISQIYFERYWTAYKHSRLANICIALTIIVTYFIQEFCLLQLSLLNINEMAFLQVISVTMIFRDDKIKLWWWLLVLTPIYANVLEYLMGIGKPIAWWIWLVESLIFWIICRVLTQCYGIAKRCRYLLAIACLGVVELISLAITNSFTVSGVSAATLGLLVIAVCEERRYVSELRNDQEMRLLRQESERDDLTGLLNYRSLVQQIEELAHNQEIYNIVIGALDIDHFKHVNDTYGHFVGNEVLNHFSTVFRKQIHAAFPHHGYVYRFGGEEFTIVVSNHSLMDVDNLMQTIQESFRQEPVVTKSGVEIHLSFSCGLTNRLNNEKLESTLKRADKMLYSVKNHGRGWIITDYRRQTDEGNN